MIKHPNRVIRKGKEMNKSENENALPIKLAYRVNEFCYAVGISRSTFYKTVKRGDPQFQKRFDELRAKYRNHVEILGEWSP